MAFTHFHVHSQYSILDGAASVPGLVEKAIADGMKAISLTDHGNMVGIKLFYDTCRGWRPTWPGCLCITRRNRWTVRESI